MSTACRFSFWICNGRIRLFSRINCQTVGTGCYCRQNGKYDGKNATTAMVGCGGENVRTGCISNSYLCNIYIAVNMVAVTHTCVCTSVCFADGRHRLTLADVLFFATGVKRMPPLGFNPPPTLQFLHDKEANGELSRFPKANTCSCCVSLPVLHNTFEQFTADMVFAIGNTQGYGFA